MLLERLEIVGFRGINRISLLLDKGTILIGENQWGKSSLLNALTLLLSPENKLYRFTESDFYRDKIETQHLHVIFTFCETEDNPYLSPHYQLFSSIWIKGDDDRHRIYYRIDGDKSGQQVQTKRMFLNAVGEPLPINNVEVLSSRINQLCPVLRLRDSRKLNDSENILVKKANKDNAVLQRINQMVEHFSKLPQSQKLSDTELRRSVEGIRYLIENYFALQTCAEKPCLDSEVGVWQSVKMLTQLIENIEKEGGSTARDVRIILLGLFIAILRVDVDCQPILILEDPESRFHPIMMSVVWGLIEHLPLQKLITTNSSQLLSLVPVERICRMVRDSSSVTTYRLLPNGLNRIDYRRIAFHIRFYRSSSLFARSWLLVEGETEVWMLGELARQCGYHLESEGVKIIEFAQCGLKPLLKFVHQMGIEWHVLVDGDEAGKKYANTVRSFSLAKHQHEKERLTVLPALDLENFMYQEGFADVYHRVAGIPTTINISIKKVIYKAIHRTSKPDLAIEVAEEADMRGVESIPALLRKMFSKVVWRARGN